MTCAWCGQEIPPEIQDGHVVRVCAVCQRSPALGCLVSIVISTLIWSLLASLLLWVLRW